MTYEEVKNVVNRINELQAQYIKGDSTIRAGIKKEWYPLCLSVRMGGFKLQKHLIKDEVGRTIGYDWYVKDPTKTRKRNKHSESFEYVNLRPEGVKTRVGDCTTRCIAYCLGKDYLKVLSSQKRMQKRFGIQYNGYYSWDRPLVEKGWNRIKLPHKIVRHELAKMLSAFKYPIATSSSGHVCPIHHGKVIDTWESQNGRVESITVNKKDYDKIRSVVEKFC